MPIDRAATYRQAEKLVRQGKLEQAITEYRLLVDDQPKDYNTVNQLGDLYVRVGQIDNAIEQFGRVAEGFRSEGFIPRAVAVYKKILKLRPDADGALIQAGELSAHQGNLKEARGYFAAAVEGRRSRGDARGALQVVARAGLLDPDDVEARMAGVHARIELEDDSGALRELKAIANLLIERGREAEAVAPLREAVRINPADVVVVRSLARVLIRSGQADEGAALVTPDVAGGDVSMATEAAAVLVRKGDSDAAMQLVERLPRNEADVHAAVGDLSVALAADHPEPAFAFATRVLSVLVERGELPRAVALLQRFAEANPRHVPALMRLVELAMDAGSDETMTLAQALLADAYLASGAAAEARYVAEDLVSRHPWERAHYARLRASIASAGEHDPDATVADWLAVMPAFGFEDEPAAAAVDAPAAAAHVATSVPEPPAATAVAAHPAPPSPPSPLGPHAIDLSVVFGRTRPRDDVQLVEEDLSVVLDAIKPAPTPAVQPARDVDEVFARIRGDAEHQLDDAADVAYTRGAALFQAGDLVQSTEQLRIATRSPRRRFAASLLLAQIFEQQKRTRDAIEWLGHAVDSHVVILTDRYDALIRLATLLESTGESARALAVCLELQADAGNYRDVADRIERLSRAQAGG